MAHNVAESMDRRGGGGGGGRGVTPDIFLQVFQILGGFLFGVVELCGYEVHKVIEEARVCQDLHGQMECCHASCVYPLLPSSSQVPQTMPTCKGGNKKNSGAEP
jgi:hypothetical protein